MIVAKINLSAEFILYEIVWPYPQYTDLEGPAMKLAFWPYGFVLF
jgi:hypothetical protein